MNYQALKTMIESLIQSYKCPECSSGIDENSIDIMGAAGSNVNIDIQCPKCGKHSMVKSQVMHVNAENLGQLKNSLLNIKNKMNQNKENNSIKDKEIIDLSKDLKNSDLSVSDLFEK